MLHKMIKEFQGIYLWCHAIFQGIFKEFLGIQGIYQVCIIIGFENFIIIILKQI